MLDSIRVPSDTRGRRLRDLRVSVTDRCNFRCTYCMPKSVFGASYRFMERSELLSFEEIHRLASIFVSRGVRKIRITGGEPLIRRDIERLIEMLAEPTKEIPELCGVLGKKNLRYRFATLDDRLRAAEIVNILQRLSGHATVAS